MELYDKTSSVKKRLCYFGLLPNWTVQMVKGVARWLGRRAWVLLGDGSYACVELAWACLGQQVTLVSRLRLDARLYEFPAPVAAGRRGPKPKKGKRLPALKTRLEEAQTEGDRATVAWYGGERKPVRLLTGVCLWHTPGETPLPIRWVLVVDPTGKARSEAFFSTDSNLIPETLVEGFVLHWNVEVTFEEGRRHLGLETQRQGSDKAIARTTPALLGLFVFGLPDGLSTPRPHAVAASIHHLVSKARSHFLRRIGLRQAGYLGGEIFGQLYLAP
jgi:hypothetical protein